MSEGPRVFIPQHPSKYNAALGESVNDGDMSGIMAFGHPIFMLPRGKLRDRQLHRTIRWLEAAMFDFNESDYLAVVGDPVVYSAAVLIASRRVRGPINVIRWHRRTNEFKTFQMYTGAGHVARKDNA